MNFPITFAINASGLFDFDLTFPTEALLFLILATVVTFIFLSPISKQIDERAEFINYTLRKSTILLTFVLIISLISSTSVLTACSLSTLDKLLYFLCNSTISN
jgi:uncharacterized membrane protein